MSIVKLTPLEKLRFIKLWMYDAGEDAIERFERIGMMFYKDTGYLRPGKSYPLGRDVPENLNEIFQEWCESKANLCHEMLDSLIEREAD